MAAVLAHECRGNAVALGLARPPRRGRAHDHHLSHARGSRADSTWRAYDSDFADFRTWCAEQAPPVESLPAREEQRNGIHR